MKVHGFPLGLHCEPTGLPGSKPPVPLTEDVGVVAGGEAMPPWPLGLTTVDDEGDTEGDA